MIIGLSGYARAGKDTVALHLAAKGFEMRAFADPMREALLRINPQLEVGGLFMDLRNAVEAYGWDVVKEKAPAFRGLIQRFGTEVGREMFGSEVWVNLALKDLPGRVVFSDVRFPNEAEAILARGGQVWRVTRPGVEATNGHPSESAMDGFDFDFELLNTSFEDLFRQVDERLSPRVRESGPVSPGENVREFYRRIGRREVYAELRERLLPTICHHADAAGASTLLMNTICNGVEDEFYEIFEEGK